MKLKNYCKISIFFIGIVFSVACNKKANVAPQPAGGDLNFSII